MSALAGTVMGGDRCNRTILIRPSVAIKADPSFAKEKQ